jgi:8-oxo-dGTP diphosphatase
MKPSEEQRPKVGIGVFIIKDGKVLLGQRKSVHGDGEYAPPGGHMEYMESFEEVVKREVQEEVGIEIKNIQFLCLMNVQAYAPRHYVNVGFTAEWESGEVRNMEPDKCLGWDWYDIESLPQPLFATVLTYAEAYKTGKNFFDA